MRIGFQADAGGKVVAAPACGTLKWIRPILIRGRAPIAVSHLSRAAAEPVIKGVRPNGVTWSAVMPEAGYPGNDGVNIAD